MSAHSIRKSLWRSRFPESGQPCSAWNHVRHVLGGTPGTEAAYRGAGQFPLLAGGIAQMLAPWGTPSGASDLLRMLERPEGRGGTRERDDGREHGVDRV